MTITKETYKISDLCFLNDKSTIFFGKNPIYPMESLSREEKIAMMDSFEDGIASYMIDLIEKYNVDKEAMPKDNWGGPKTNSVKAWMKKNDTRNLIYKRDGQKNYEEYRMFGTEHSQFSLTCGSGRWSTLLYHNQDIVNQWFHDFHIQMQKKEQEWFNDNDPHMLKLREVRKRGDKYGVFENQLLNDVVYNRKDTTDKNLDYFIEKYVEIEKAYKSIIDDMNNVEFE